MHSLHIGTGCAIFLFTYLILYAILNSTEEMLPKQHTIKNERSTP